MRKYSRFVIFLLVFAIFLGNSAVLYADDSKTKHHDLWGFPHKDGIVLVLSGGGTKGLSHIGVFEILEREKIPIAAIVGTSMGAIMGGLYASGYTAAEMREVLENVNLMEIISDRSGTVLVDTGYNRPPSSGSSMFYLQMDEDKNMRSKIGVLNAKDLYAFLSELTSRTTATDFDYLPIPFAAMATDLETGDSIALRDGNLASALRASMSIPGIFEPWEMDGKLLVDGGLKANLPVIAAKKMFPGHPVVAVNLSPKHMKRSRKQLRSLIEIASQTLDILMAEQVIENLAEADLEIAPDVSGFGVLASDGYDVIIERGVAAAEAKKEELHALLKSYQEKNANAAHIEAEPLKIPVVRSVRFEGVPASMAEHLHDQYQEWVGKPLDMKKFSETLKLLSAREEFLSVQGRTPKVGKNSVDVVFSIARPPRYEFNLDGYVGNVNPNSWLSLSAQIRDILQDGDVGSIEYRLGNKWGVMGRYFTPVSSNESQWGLVLAAREEGYEPKNAETFEFERYTARLAWYKSINPRLRIGIGYALERASIGDTQSGPYFNLSFNTLDDPVLPTKGVSIVSDIWAPIDDSAVSHTLFQAHLPIWKKWKVIFSGGLRTGDVSDPAFAALLGANEEIYSLAARPLVGDQAFWLHLGAAKLVMKSWWGGINIEFFGNYGEVLKDWHKTDDWWETGVSLSIPTNNFAGKFTVVYDKNDEFTFGYSFGLPRWWNGPLP